MWLGALDVDYISREGSACAGIRFLCPNCGKHDVELYFLNPPDMGPHISFGWGHKLYRCDVLKPGLARTTIFGLVDLGPCGFWRLTDGDIKPYARI